MIKDFENEVTAPALSLLQFFVTAFGNCELIDFVLGWKPNLKKVGQVEDLLADVFAEFEKFADFFRVNLLWGF